MKTTILTSIFALLMSILTFGQDVYKVTNLSNPNKISNTVIITLNELTSNTRINLEVKQNDVVRVEVIIQSVVKLKNYTFQDESSNTFFSKPLNANNIAVSSADIPISYSNIHIIFIETQLYPIFLAPKYVTEYTKDTDTTNGGGGNTGGTTGLSENVVSDMTFYPNPVTDVLNLKLANMQISHLQILDVKGLFVKDVPVGFNTEMVQIPVNELEQGTYFISIPSESKPIRFQKI
jgi:hypothetical protein